MKQFHYDLTVKLEAPFASQGLQANALGVDCPLIRNHEGSPIIPGTLVAGMVRDVMGKMLERITESPGAKAKTIISDALIDDWFGKGSGNAVGDEPDASETPFEPKRRKLVFRDLVCTGDSSGNPSILTRIQIEPKRGSVKRGHLQVIEQLFLPGEEVPFKGQVSFLGSDEEAGKMETVLAMALELIPALGAFKSAGFGRVCETAKLGKRREQEITPSGPSAIAFKYESQYFELRFLDPFLVDSDVFGGNIHRGREVIPGAVIKGCLARSLELTGRLNELNDDLSKTIISHALPAEDKDDAIPPKAIPLTVFFCDKKIYDLFNYVDVFEDLPETKNNIIKFQSDWKNENFGLIGPVVGWPAPSDHYVRTRTAISSKTGVTEKNALFSQQMIIPSGKKWIFSIDPAGASEGNFKTIVNCLLGGLESVGPTMARAECRQATIQDQLPVAHREGKWRITLQSQAMMFRTADCIRKVDGDEPDLKGLYRNYWRQILSYYDWAGQEPEITDFRFFAAQAWDGGYRARRYCEDTSQYLPNILTQPGSVFEFALSGPGLDAQKNFFAFLAGHGLPVPMATGFRQPRLWKICAYTPENGYGRVTVDWHDADLLQGGLQCSTK